MVARGQSTADNAPDSTPKDKPSAQGATRIVSPLTYEAALDLADAVLYRDPGQRMGDRIARALMAVDQASREQARGPVHDAATCKTCQAITARRNDDDYVNAPWDDWQMPK